MSLPRKWSRSQTRTARLGRWCSLREARDTSRTGRGLSDSHVFAEGCRRERTRSGSLIGNGTGCSKGFVIGRVIAVVRNPIAGLTSAVVQPSVRFDEIEQVFVVKPAQALTQ